MTLKFKIETLEGLSEGVAGLYVEKDGAYFLEVDGAVSAADHDEVKSKYLSAKDEAIQKRLKEKEWKALGESPDAVRALMSDAKKGGAGAEDAQARLDAMAASHQAEIKDRDTRLDAMVKRSAGAEFKAELSKAGFMAGIDMVADYNMQKRIQVTDDGTIKVLTLDGKAMHGNGPDHGATLADLAQELAASEDMQNFVRNNGMGGGAKPAGSQGGTPKAKWSEMTSGAKVALNRSNPTEYERIKAAG
jgi:hypothetical protein